MFWYAGSVPYGAKHRSHNRGPFRRRSAETAEEVGTGHTHQRIAYIDSLGPRASDLSRHAPSGGGILFLFFLRT